ncbi:MAG TPA: peptidoglycan-binding domain-containing protein [Caulobacteraceae bacterium]|jgi:hypothetical protein|nr:peptidoglycan-binding domain-containing protein [Caulobacteraceae bacterium]
MKTLLAGAAASTLLLNPFGMAYAQAPDLPPNAVVGHCYGKVLVPEQSETYTEQVLETPARTEVRVFPAVMGEVEQRVVATEAYTQRETIPATYRTVVETVVVRPAGVRRETVPAVVETETRQVLVRPARTVWKRGAPGPHNVVVPGSRRVVATGEVICLVEVPAEYRTVTRTVVRRPETVREVPIPAETATVTRQVLDQPARVIERQVPATYKTVRVPTVIQPERTETIQIPATYRTVVRQRTTAPSRFEWREVACQQSQGGPATGYGAPPPRRAPPPAAYHDQGGYLANPAAPAAGGDTTVRSMQSALHDRGYYNGPINGLFSQQTQDAMTRFQRDAHLAVGRLTPETAGALGLAR